MGRGNLKLVGDTRPRTRAVERRADETEADRATRELAFRLSAPTGRLLNENYRNITRGETRPAQAIARRLAEARDAGVSLEWALDVGMQWLADLITAVYCEQAIDQHGPRPTAPGAARKAA